MSPLSSVQQSACSPKRNDSCKRRAESSPVKENWSENGKRTRTEIAAEPPINKGSFSMSDEEDVGTCNLAENRRKIIEVIKKQIEILINWNPKEEQFFRLAVSDITKKLEVSFDDHLESSLFFAALAKQVEENPIIPQFPAFIDKTVQELNRILQEYPEKSFQAECAFLKLALRFDVNKNYESLEDLYKHLSHKN